MKDSTLIWVGSDTVSGNFFLFHEPTQPADQTCRCQARRPHESYFINNRRGKIHDRAPIRPGHHAVADAYLTGDLPSLTVL